MSMPIRFAPIAAIAVFLFTIALPDTSHALRSTNQESFTDPDYFGYQPKAMIIRVLSNNLKVRKIIEERLTKAFQKRGIKVYLYKKLFSPTRDWDAVQRKEIYERYSIEAGLAVGIGASSRQTTQVGSFTSGSATATGYGNSATAYGNSTTTALFNASSSASFSGVMIDLSEDRVAWTTDIYTEAGGLFFVGAKGDAKAAAKAIIKGLIESSHIPKK